ncbi:diguanylate cyclase, partial [Ferrovum myxofaciens]|uniref:diguanylate cyclase n=1 Tax=Ferrovum myxofaciens TaxID=416213 RepID=UPI0012E73D68
TLGFHTCSPVSQSEEEYAEKLSGKIQRRWLTAYFYPDDDSDGQNLLRYADQAMYVAKQTGRNQFHFFNAVTN